jgi:hypothetical protein
MVSLTCSTANFVWPYMPGAVFFNMEADAGGGF